MNLKALLFKGMLSKIKKMSGGELCRALVFIYHDPITICFVATDEQVSN